MILSLKILWNLTFFCELSEALDSQRFWYFAEKKAKFCGIFWGKFAEKSVIFAGKSQNSRKNDQKSADFAGKKVKIRGKIGWFRGIFGGEKSKFAEKSADFAGFLAEKSQIWKDFQGQILR